MDQKHQYRRQLTSLPSDIFKCEVTAQQSYLAGRQMALGVRREILTGDVTGESTKTHAHLKRRLAGETIPHAAERLT